MASFINLNESRGKWLLAGVILVSGMAILDGTVVTVALPTMQRDLSASFTSLQWIVNAYALSLAALLLAAGVLGDRYGQRRVTCFGVIWFLMSSIACGYSINTEALIISRGLQGLGGALMIPGSLAIINMCFSPESRGKAIGLWAGASGGIAALGPLLGGYLVEASGWPSIFFINIPLALLALLILMKFAPKLAPKEAKLSLDILGLVSITIALLCISIALTEGPRLGLSNYWVLLSIVVGLLSFVLFAINQKKQAHPVLPKALLKTKVAMAANWITFCVYFALNGLIFFVAFNLQQLQGLSPTQAGLGLLPPIVAISFLSGYGGTLADKYGARQPLLWGILITAFGMVLLALAPQHGEYMTSFFPGLCCFGVGMSLAIAPITKSALMVPENISGTASGFNNSVSRTAALISVASLGAVASVFFKQKMQALLEHSEISQNLKNYLLSNTDKLAGIQIPNTFSAEQIDLARAIISSAFYNAYTAVIWACVAMTLLGALVVYRYIRS